MILTHQEATGKFVFLCSFNEKETAKSAGFRWNPTLRRWETENPDAAKRLIRYADDRARDKLADRAVEFAQQLAASRQAEADVEVPAPAGLDYLPYQRAGIAYAMKRRDVLIADEMGLGKTVQAIGLVNASDLPPVARILIVCPASLRLNWVTEWRRWCVHKIRPVVVNDVWHAAIGGGLFADSVAVIMSYEGAVKWKEKIDRTAWAVAVFDEAHYLKTAGARRTKAVFGFQRENHRDYEPPIRATKRLFLTGTPIVNRPEELWPLVHSIDPKGLGANRKRYFTDYVWTDAPDLRELHDLLRARVMVRRLKSQVLKDLPAKRRQMVLLDPSGFQGALAAERAVISAKAEELKLLRHENAVAKLTPWRGVAMTEISRVRHEMAVKKIPAVVEHCFRVLEETNKLVVFAHHHDVMDGLAAELPGAVIFDGRMTDEQKDAAKTKFLTDPRCRVFIGSIKAAGVGITLTVASTVVFAELDWTPAAMVQAEDRLHRIGQADKVLVQHLVVDGSIDQRMSAMLIEKAALIDKILDGGHEAPEAARKSILDEVLEQ